MSAFADLAGLSPLRIWDGVVGRVVEGRRATLCVLELDPDSVVPEHSHDNEQIGVLLAGSVTFRIGDETRQLVPGGTWSIPASVPHAVETGPDGAVVAELFAPPRADWADLEALEPSPPRWPS